MARLSSLTLVVAVVSGMLVSTAGAAFPSHPMDPARGASPLTPGTLFVRAGAGGGTDMPNETVAGGAIVGLGIEGQVSESMALGVEVGTGIETFDAKRSVLPGGTHLTLQYNPQGWDGMALRASAGLGVDYFVDGFEPAAWLGATGSVVSSRALGPLEVWASGSLGARQFLGGPDTPLLKIADIGETGMVHNSLLVDGGLGLRYDVTDAFGVYGAAHLSGTVILLGEEPVLSPAATAQVGVSWSFDAP